MIRLFKRLDLRRKCIVYFAGDMIDEMNKTILRLKKENKNLRQKIEKLEKEKHERRVMDLMENRL